MRFHKFLAAMLFLASATDASITLPQGTNPCLKGPEMFKNRDSLHILYNELWDTKGSHITIGFYAVTDSAGFPVRVERKMSVWSRGDVSAISSYGFDAQGYTSLQIDYSVPDKLSDTLRSVWNHATCADLERVSQRARWSVDAQGLCSFGINERKKGEVWSFADSTKLLWAGSVLKAAYRINLNGDTLERLEYTLDADSHPARIEGYVKSTSGWYHASTIRYVYSAGVFQSSVDDRTSEEGLPTSKMVLSVRASDLESLALSSIGRRVATSLRLLRTETGWVVSNPTAEPMVVRFVQPNGRDLEVIRLEAGASAKELSAFRNIVLWSASTPSGASSGILLP